MLITSKEFEQTFLNFASSSQIQTVYKTRATLKPDSQGLSSKSCPPHHEIGENGDPDDAHHKGDGVVSLPVLVLGVRDADPHGDHEGQGKGPHDLAHDGIAGTTSDVIHIRLLSLLLGTLLLLHLQRLLRFVLFPVLRVERA